MNEIHCDVCGKPVNFSARDLREVVDENHPGVRSFVPEGEFRYGCIEHPPDPPKTFYLDGSIEIVTAFDESVDWWQQSIYQMKWGLDDK